MRMRTLVVSGLMVGGLLAIPAPADASCNEVGDPSCTVGGVVNASVCAAQEVAKSGGKPDMQTIADCFTQTT